MTVSALVLLRNLTRSFGKCGLGWRVWSGVFDKHGPSCCWTILLLAEGRKRRGAERNERAWLPSQGNLINVKSSFEEPVNTARKCTTETGSKLGLPRTWGVGGGGERRSHY